MRRDASEKRRQRKKWQTVIFTVRRNSELAHLRIVDGAGIQCRVHSSVQALNRNAPTPTNTPTHILIHCEGIESPRYGVIETISGCTVHANVNYECWMWYAKLFLWWFFCTLRNYYYFSANIFALSSHLTISSFIWFEMSSIATVCVFPLLGIFFIDIAAFATAEYG